MGIEADDLTQVLARTRAGDVHARGELVARIYDELRQVASRMMKRERVDHTLSPTAIVHEALLRMLGEEVLERAPDRHFVFAAAARAMREILVDHSRYRAAAKRGGRWQRVSFDHVLDYFEAQKLDVSELHEAVGRLTALDERQGQVITLRYFGGMTMPEVAQSLGVSLATAERDCRLARAWLYGEFRKEREK
jgi:RNA polymerase sigma factor (TIGR02999 family)